MTGRDTTEFTAALVVGALLGAALTAVLRRARGPEPRGILATLARLRGGG